MIELLLQAERALSVGMLDQAERMYRQAAAADPRNSIAVVGLARVALERGEDVDAWRWTQDALAIDPENVAAQRLASRLEEVYAYRGQSIQAMAADGAAEASATEPAPAAEPVPTSEAEPAPEPAAQPEPQRDVEVEPAAEPVPEAEPEPAARPEPEVEAAAEPEVQPEPEPLPAPATPSPVAPAHQATDHPTPTPARRGLLDRLLRRNSP